jgi:tetratricopeptide (TPR) repeat protein
MPGLGLGHWLAATVFVARNALDEAARELAAGILAQDQPHDAGRFRSVGLHLLHGLVLLALGNVQGADAELGRELATEPAGHLYARQAAAHTWSAVGAVRLQQDRREEAVAAFERALDRLPGHPPALAALSVVGDEEARRTARTRLDERVAALEALGAHVEAATALAAADVLGGHGEEAATRLATALESASTAGSSGWTIPVDPLLRVSANAGQWRHVIAIVGRGAA